MNINDIKAAQKIIAPYLQPTPLVPLYSLNKDGLKVYGKLEITQPIGVFKIRGALHAVAKLTQQQREKGVVCASTGNHGRALSYAVKLLGGTATICMSPLVPKNKLDAIEKLGAKIRIYGKSQDEAQLLVDKLVSEQGFTEIPPFDHQDVVAGQGTIGLEILEQLADVDSILVPLSGGGLIAGITHVAKTINPKIKIIGISPRRCAAMKASIDAGKPINVEELKTVADSLGGGIGLDNQHTFEVIKKYVDKIILLSETQIKQAMQHIFFQENIVVEGAGAVGVSTLITDEIYQEIKPLLGQKTVLILSGKNIDMNDFLSIMQEDFR